MDKIIHTSAKSSHYNKEALYYDLFNEENSTINKSLEKLLKKYKVKTVLDLACGTGSQVFWLNKKGFQVIGYDINTKMLNIAREKAQQNNANLKFSKGDMRVTYVGEFDAVITMFNAIGHLTKQDFAKAIRNICSNLKTDGLYIFDIFNLYYLLQADNITKLTIDWLKTFNSKIMRKVQYSTIDEIGTLTSHTIEYCQAKFQKPKKKTSTQTLQVYTVEELKELLESNGFKILRQCDINGSRFSESKTERILTVARRARNKRMESMSH